MMVLAITVHLKSSLITVRSDIINIGVKNNNDCSRAGT
jgi:hypothetical protein